MLQLFEAELESGIARQSVQERFQFAPVWPLAGDEFPEVDDHELKPRDGVTGCWGMDRLPHPHSNTL